MATQKSGHWQFQWQLGPQPLSRWPRAIGQSLKAPFCFIISLCMTLLLLCYCLCLFFKHGLFFSSGSAALCVRWAGDFRKWLLDSQLTALALIRTRCRAGTHGETSLLINTGCDWTNLEPADTLSTHPQHVGCHQSFPCGKKTHHWHFIMGFYSVPKAWNISDASKWMQMFIV